MTDHQWRVLLDAQAVALSFIGMPDVAIEAMDASRAISDLLNAAESLSGAEEDVEPLPF